MNTLQMQKVMVSISEMNISELRQIAEYVNIAFKTQAHREAQKFSAGDVVYFTHPKKGVIKGTVQKVNTKTVSILTKTGAQWNVAGSLLKAM